MSDYLNLLNVNVNSFRPRPDDILCQTTGSIKRENLAELAASLETHIICLTETWLCPSETDKDVALDGYNSILRKDRPDSYGGVALLLKNGIQYQNMLIESTLEIICAKVIFNNMTYYICCVYRPPTTTNRITDEFIGEFSRVVTIIRDQCNSTDHLIIAGDFNFHTKEWWQGSKDTVAGSKFNACLLEYDLNQVVGEPTHITRSGSSLLDLFIVDLSIETKIAVHPALTDKCKHHPVSCSVTSRNNNTPSKETFRKKVYKFAELNTDAIIAMNNHIYTITDWENQVRDNDVDDTVDYLTKSINETIDMFVRHKNITIHKDDKSWLQRRPHLKNLIRKRNKAFANYKRLHALGEVTTRAWTTYCKLRTHVQKDIHEAKKEDIAKFANNIDENINKKEFYTQLSKVIGKGKGCKNIDCIEGANGITHNNMEMAKAFSSYFANNSTIREPYPEPPPSIPLTHFRLNKPDITEHQITTSITALDENKSGGHDLINNKIIKLLAPALAPILNLLFSKSLADAYFPTSWKKSNVIPIYKGKGEKTALNNYRPISLTCSMGKLFESCVLKHLEIYLIHTVKWISPRQSGFTRGDSTTFQLTSIIDEITRALSNRKYVRYIFLDIEKAFDKAWHTAILNKLAQAGVSDPLLSWIKSYLENRDIRVLLNNGISEWIKINCGVPQGAVLAPLLFLIFINDLPEDLFSTTKLFADDTSLYAKISYNENEHAVSMRMQEDLDRIHAWSIKNLLVFNPTKIKEVIVTNSTREVTPLKFNGIVIERVSCYKHLGLKFQDNFKWNNFIADKIKSMKNLLNMLKPLKRHLTRKTLQKAYFTYIRPLIEYMTPFLGDIPLHLMKLIESTQYAACRVVANVPKGTPYLAILKDLGWSTINERFTYLRLLTYFKMYHCISPNYLNCLISTENQPSPTHEYNLRRNNNARHWTCTLPPAPSAATKKLFVYITTLEWNNLPQELVSELQLTVFKYKLKKILLSCPQTRYYSADRTYNGILTQLRLGFSNLHAHQFKRHIRDSPLCTTCNKPETTLHYLLLCPNYSVPRTKLLLSVKPILSILFPYIPTEFSMALNISNDIAHTLVAGNDELGLMNANILNATRSFIKESCRFRENNEN